MLDLNKLYQKSNLIIELFIKLNLFSGWYTDTDPQVNQLVLK